MNAASERWPNQSFLDALRPEPGWSVGWAVLATYSADIVSIGAALLALAGRDDDRGTGTRADFAEAVEALRNRVRIVIQRGRLAKPHRLPAVAGILDQFLQEVPYDEKYRSWHPKVALLRLDHPTEPSAWRLWLGSRNLTASQNLDLGLLLTSEGKPMRGATSQIPGVKSLAERLLNEARLPNIRVKRVASEMERLVWQQPSGLKVDALYLTTGEGGGSLPVPPAKADEVIVVSPFLDADAVEAIGTWGDAGTHRSLLSTYPELRRTIRQRASSLAGFAGQILALDAPVPELVEAARAESPFEEGGAQAGADYADPTEEPPKPGIHAKIVAVRVGQKWRLWIGSANATMRAWKGRNVEIIAQISAPAALGTGLRELLGQAQPVSITSLAHDATPETQEVQDRLNDARREVAARWTGRLARAGNQFSIEGNAPPHPQDPEIAIDVGLATGSLVPWPRDECHVELGVFPPSLHTELIQVRLRLGEHDSIWLQRVPVSPAIDDGRDRAALAQHLGPRAFLEWIQALLNGNAAAGAPEDDWDQERTNSSADLSAEIPFAAVTLEDILSCWARDRAAFARADARMGDYLEMLIAQANKADATGEAQLRSLQDLWHTVRTELLEIH